MTAALFTTDQLLIRQQRPNNFFDFDITDPGEAPLGSLQSVKHREAGGRATELSDTQHPVALLRCLTRLTLKRWQVTDPDGTVVADLQRQFTISRTNIKITMASGSIIDLRSQSALSQEFAVLAGVDQVGRLDRARSGFCDRILAVDTWTLHCAPQMGV